MNRLLIFGGVCAVLIVGMVNIGGADPIVNTGKVSYEDPETGKVVTRESVPAVINGPYLTITKEANKKSVKPGEEVEYTIIVKNIGTEPAKNVRISDRLPDELRYIGCEGIVYDENGGVIERGEAKTIKEPERAKDGEEFAAYQGKHFSISVKKGSTSKELRLSRLREGTEAWFKQKAMME